MVNTIPTGSGDEASAEETSGGRAPMVQQGILVGAAASYTPSRSSEDSRQRDPIHQQQIPWL